MIKTQVLVKRLDGMTPESFADYWLSVHSPIVRGIPGIVRQTVSIVRTDLQRSATAWDGLANAWWESGDALRAASAHPAYRKMLEDEKNFVDLSMRRPLVVQEINPVAPLEPPRPAPDIIKVVNPLHKREDLAYDAFSAYWRGPHAELNNAMPHMKAYIQNHIHPDFRDNDRACDGIAESWFRSLEEIIEIAKSEAYQKLKEDEPNLIAPDSLTPMFCTEVQTI
jgi:uncharacterized protein (TIGR02118 family)